jgi:PTH1 family peptidyl-tRNA hydrolase
MKLIVGLGNPGGRYAGNRHNIGFMAVDAIAAEHGFGPWRAKFQGDCAEGRLGADKALLLRPMTYMNESGRAVREAMKFFKLTPADVTVFHDELDLAPGKVRVKTGGGHAGHNGLRSISAHLGPDFTRVRLGIGHPGDRNLVSNYVLSDFAKADRDWLDPLLDALAREAGVLADAGGPAFQQAVAARLAPAKATSAKPPEPGAEKGEPTPPDAAPSPFDGLKSLANRLRGGD